MTVIALTQEMGSLAKDVADALASDLGLHVMRHEVVDHVVEPDARADEPRSTGCARARPARVERLRADRASLAVYMTEEVLDVAARGNVVLRGWGATCLLRPVPHVVCVRITRPFEQARRVAAWSTSSTDDVGFAEDEIRRSDRAHAARMNAQFGVTWGDPLLYDLVLNTDRVSVESCAQQIAALARGPSSPRPTRRARCWQSMALEARVRAALRADEATRERRRHRRRATPAGSSCAASSLERRRAAGGRARRRGRSPACRSGRQPAAA